MLSPCLRGFSPGTPASSHLQKHAEVNWLLYIARRCEWLSVLHVALSFMWMTWRLVQGVLCCSPVVS